MKKILLLSFIVLITISVFSISGNISKNNFETDLYFPVYENIYIVGSFTDETIGGGVAFDFNWEDYSTGFLKIKEKDGSLGLGIKYIDGITLFGDFEFNNNKLPFFTHSYFDGKVSLNKDFRVYTRNWIRLPFVIFNLGGQLVTFNENEYNFIDLNSYLFNSDWKKSMRFKYIDNSAILGIDLETNDTLGEFGYGGGIGYNFYNKQIGVAVYANIKADMKISKFSLYPTVIFTKDDVLMQLLITRLGVKETFSMGITIENFEIKGFFLRFEL